MCAGIIPDSDTFYILFCLLPPTLSDTISFDTSILFDLAVTDDRWPGRLTSIPDGYDPLRDFSWAMLYSVIRRTTLIYSGILPVFLILFIDTAVIPTTPSFITRLMTIFVLTLTDSRYLPPPDGIVIDWRDLLIPFTLRDPDTISVFIDCIFIRIDDTYIVVNSGDLFSVFYSRYCWCRPLTSHYYSVMPFAWYDMTHSWRLTYSCHSANPITTDPIRYSIPTVISQHRQLLTIVSLDTFHWPMFILVFHICRLLPIVCSFCIHWYVDILLTYYLFDPHDDSPCFSFVLTYDDYLPLFRTHIHNSVFRIWYSSFILPLMMMLYLATVTWPVVDHFIPTIHSHYPSLHSIDTLIHSYYQCGYYSIYYWR